MTQPDAQLENLIELARQAAGNAWCPYSRFPVGAAVETADGSMFSGCNVENASSGLTACAERNAIGQAVAAGHTTIRRVVVFTPTEIPTTPCGACRQVIREFSAEAEVHCVCDGPESISTSLDELLPLNFGPGNLGMPDPGGE